MTRASDLKKSDVIEHNGSLFVIRQIEVNSPSARGAATLYRVRAAAVGGGPKFEERYKGDEDVPTVELLRRSFHAAALREHPDKQPEAERERAATKFVSLQNAYRALGRAVADHASRCACTRCLF